MSDLVAAWPIILVCACFLVGMFLLAWCARMPEDEDTVSRRGWEDFRAAMETES